MLYRTAIARSLSGACLAVMAQLAVAQTANVAGTWTMSVETPAGSGSPTFVLKQEGDKLTGRYQGALGEAPVTGSVKGDAVTMTYTVSGGGGSATVTYTGKVAGSKMSGEVDLGSIGKGRFTGQRQ